MADLTVEQAREKVDDAAYELVSAGVDHASAFDWGSRGNQGRINSARDEHREALDALIAAVRTEERARCEPLLAFGRWALDEMRQYGGGDIDGGAAQDKALALGVLIRVPVTEPCGKGCACAEYYGEFPADCLRENPALTHSPETLAAIQAGLDAARSGRVTPVTFVDHVSPTTEDRDAG